jgi:protein gp37
MFSLLRRFGRDPTTVRRTKTWRAPYRWERHAAATGVTEYVFTCALSDWFHQNADGWRPEAWQVVRDCPHLVFLVLTRRPERIPEHLPADWGVGYPNVWMGVSVERNDYLWRVDLLRRIPARIRFIAAAPLLGPLPDLDLAAIDWVVVAGESGPHFRPMDLVWARQVRDKALAAGAVFFYKQGAARKPDSNDRLDGVEWKQLPGSDPMGFPRICDPT